MVKREDVLNKINSDLYIARYNAESKNQHTSRIIYSALSMWVRFSTLELDILAPSEKNSNGVSKKHVVNRCKPFLKQMLKLFPESRDWFYPPGRDSDNPITVVRERLYQSGQLVDVGFGTRVGLPEGDECLIDSRVRIRKGVIQKPFNYMSGLAQLIVQHEVAGNEDRDSIRDFFSLTDQSAEKVLKRYLTHIQWQTVRDFNGEIFDKHSGKSFSSCWSSDLILEDNDITLFRRGLNDYGFIKRECKSLYISSISEFLIKQYEVRRLMYGLKKEANTRVRAELKRYPKNRVFELQLYNDLPIKEKSILLLVGWPINHIDDHLHLLFHESVWALVKSILQQLHIDLEGES